MNNPFDDVNLASFGIEDNHVDHNSSIDAGGGTEQSRLFTREELIKHVTEEGLFDEHGNITEKGRVYLLNDQGFLDAFPTAEAQDQWFTEHGFNGTAQVPSGENFDPGNDIDRDFNLDFSNLMQGGTDNSGKTSDNVISSDTEGDNDEAKPVHADGTPLDTDTTEQVVPQEQDVSLESFILQAANISVEDVSVPLNPDGSVPADINTQMAVIPLTDPTEPKTWEEHYADMDLEPASVTSDDATVSIDEALLANSSVNGILASTGFDLTVASEDLSQGDAPNVDREIEALQEINRRITDREDQATQIFNNLIENNGVDRETAEQLEKMKAGIITSQYSLEQFGRYPTLAGYQASLEASERVLMGAKLAGGAVLFGMLIKIVMYIRDKLKGATRVTEANREAVRKATEKLNAELIRIERDYADELAGNDKFKAAYSDMAKRYNLRANLGSTSLLEVNDGIRTFVVHKNLKPRFNKVMELLVKGDSIQQLTRILIDSLQAMAPAVEGAVHDLLNKFSSPDEIDVEQYKLDFSFVGGLEKALGISSNGTDVERLTFFNDKYRQMLQPNSGVATPTFNKLMEFKFDMNGAYQFDDKYDRTLTKMLGDLGKLNKQAEVLQDQKLAANRKECVEILKAQLQGLLRLTTSLIATRDSASTLLKGGSGATKTAVQEWQKLFQNTGITFSA